VLTVLVGGVRWSPGSEARLSVRQSDVFYDWSRWQRIHIIPRTTLCRTALCPR